MIKTNKIVVSALIGILLFTGSYIEIKNYETRQAIIQESTKETIQRENPIALNPVLEEKLKDIIKIEIS